MNGLTETKSTSFKNTIENSKIDFTPFGKNTGINSLLQTNELGNDYPILNQGPQETKSLFDKIRKQQIEKTVQKGNGQLE